MMRLLLVGHARYAEGLASALSMLMGAREWVVACGMDEETGPDAFRAQVESALDAAGPEASWVLLADIAGGSPARCAQACLTRRGVEFCAFGGASLPMAIGAVMGIEDGLDLATIAESVAAEGAQATRVLA